MRVQQQIAKAWSDEARESARRSRRSMADQLSQLSGRAKPAVPIQRDVAPRQNQDDFPAVVVERRQIEQKLENSVTGKTPLSYEEEERLKARFRVLNPKAAMDHERKVSFPTREAADAKASVKSGDPVESYFCAAGGDYHLRNAGIRKSLTGVKKSDESIF